MLGKYWALPEEERAAYRRRLREMWNLPESRVPTEPQMIGLLHTYNRGLRQPIFLGGAMGGAKSAWLCMLAIHLCNTIPNNRFLLARKTFSSFRGSTLVELEEQLESMPQVKHWPGKHEVDFPNGSKIVYMGVGEPKQREKLGSYQFGGVGIDEAPEVEHDVVRMLQTRLRLKAAQKANRLILALTGNPYPGWIREDFVKAPKPGYSFVRALTRDNPHLDPRYEADMKAEMPGAFLFDTTVRGNSNAGHVYGTDITEDDRKALIEYLKTL